MPILHIKPLAFIVLFVTLISTAIQARQLTFNTYADRLLNDDAYYNLVKKQCEKTARDYGIVWMHVEGNYNNLKDSIVLLSKPLIEKKFKELETKISKQKIKDPIAISLFEKSMSNAISQTLLKNRYLREALFKKDLNDRIISFDSKIIIDSIGNLKVTETIVIVNFNDESGNSNNTIKRGITRDFPTLYTNAAGLISSVSFKLIAIRRNGESENFRTERLRNGVRVFCGNQNVFLEEGLHTYIIEYTTAKQLKFHKTFDELYWNVTGNGWGFSIDKASCQIQLPAKATFFDPNCYTGLQGSKQHDCMLSESSQHVVSFRTMKRLSPLEGLTISISIKKGCFKEVNQFISIQQLLVDNKLVFGVLLFVSLLFITLYRYWKRVGKDPSPDVIIPTFTPPNDITPPMAGYLYHQAYTDRLFTAAVIDLAVKNKVHIDVDKTGFILKSTVYTFTSPKPKGQTNSSRNEDLYQQYGFDADELFGVSIQKGKYNSTFGSIRNRFKSHIDNLVLKQESTHNSKGYLSLNNGYIGLGIFLLIVCCFACVVYISVFKPPLSIIVYTVILLIIGFIIQIVFMRIIKSLSIEGRAMADKILGFKMYLETTEKNILDILNPPEKSIQLFEKYLPFAIALGIENKWSEKFKDIIEKSMADGYTPAYYSIAGHHSFSESSQSFASDFSSGLSSTVSSAATPPSSSGSSGSGGGGFSGGGGGGGGGGGW
ncbi:MAG: DUF2207 domain-containing protein [Bacteroidetes bacterium]|jgi:uncharacterized membrane protein YgcG|nr:DUF2207 domain-containing protein [Bacteroidota bacterium]